VQLDAVDALRGALAKLLLDTHTRMDGDAAARALATLLTAAASADAAEPSLRSKLSHAEWKWSKPLVPAPPDDPQEHTATDGAAHRSTSVAVHLMAAEVGAVSASGCAVDRAFAPSPQRRRLQCAR
jgi:hypothetical protein